MENCGWTEEQAFLGPVPLGAARDRENQPITDRTVTLKYPQYEQDTCSFMSMASELHYCASTLKMGDKVLVPSLATGTKQFVKGMNACDQ